MEHEKRCMKNACIFPEFSQNGPEILADPLMRSCEIAKADEHVFYEARASPPGGAELARPACQFLFLCARRP
jgi:hypothetical protein